MTHIKKSGRFSYRTNKRYSYSRNSNSFSNNKFRSKGNAPLLYDKHTKLAKEASAAGDRIQAEYYHQIADHYSRIMNENGMRVNNDENIYNDTKKESLNNNEIENNLQQNEPTNTEESNNIEKKEEELTEEKDNSLEAVSFISQPARKTKKIK